MAAALLFCVFNGFSHPQNGAERGVPNCCAKAGSFGASLTLLSCLFGRAGQGKGAVPMQPNFFDPELQNCLPGISLNSTLWRPDLPSRQKSGIPGSSYLYLRNSSYYFRYVFANGKVCLGHAP